MDQPTETFPEIREAVRRLVRGLPRRVLAGAGSGAGLSHRLRAGPDPRGVAVGADPGGVRRLGPRPRRGDGGVGGDPPFGLQRRRLSRADVHDGHDPAARLAGAEGEYLPKIASGELRLQAFGVTEPTAGTDTTRISTFARRDGDRYVVNGQKIWISRAEHSDLMVLLCRTTAREDAAKAFRRHERAAWWTCGRRWGTA